MIAFRSCPRCSGDVSRSRDIDAVTDICLQCGWRREYEVRTRPVCWQGRKPTPIAEQGRMKGVA